MGIFGDGGKLPGQPGRGILLSEGGRGLDADGTSMTASGVNIKRAKARTGSDAMSPVPGYADKEDHAT